MYKIIGAFLIAALLTNVALSQSYDYKVDGKDYHLNVTPADDKSKEIVHKYKLRVIDTSLGGVINALDESISETEIRPIITSTKIYLRDGYQLITDEGFRKLLKHASTIFADLKDTPWTSIKSGLTRRDWARPVLKDGEFVEGSFLIHRTIVAFWKANGTSVEKVNPDPEVKKKKRKKRNKDKEKKGK